MDCDLEYLISVSGVEGQLGKLFNKEVDVVYEMPVDDVDEMQDVESSFLLTTTKCLMTMPSTFVVLVNDCTKENQFLESNSDNLGTVVWPTLKAYIVESNPNSSSEVLYMCTYCKPLIRKDKLPSRCVLNGLTVVPVPPELSKLDVLSMQLIQRAKCYLTVVRLGTYTGKVPTYNSLKACKGTMFFLPLPLNKTLDTLEEVKHSDTANDLPDPELYVIVNGKPTKAGVVWRSLVNIDDVKAAVRKLREINWLYQNVDESLVDDAVKKVIKVVNSAHSKVLEKATSEDIAFFQFYTIRNLESKFPVQSDVDQLVAKCVKEDPISNKQQHLVVMCFPGLFPTGTFGEYHPQQSKLGFSEYIKSRLLNKDNRFRKNAQYVFYFLWQKIMREVSAGMYNLLKSTRMERLSVSSLLQQ